MSQRVALIIDDNVHDRLVISQHLQQDRDHHYAIAEACSGREGLRAASRCQPDVIVLDDDLKDMPGVDVLVALRNREHQHVPVVFLTGRTSPGPNATDPLELGADDYLNKDEVSGAHLRRAVTNAITKARMRVMLEESRASLSRALHEVEQRMVFEARLIGVVGHDLRTPLGSLSAGVEILRMEPSLTPRGQQVLDRLARSTTHMTTIVRQVLDMTGLRRGGAFSVAPHPCDVHAVVAERVEELRAYHKDRTIRLTLQGDGQGTYDATALGQVVVNLVSNALTHGAPDTPVEVAVAGTVRTVTVAVTNRGEPVPPDEQETLFEPFRRSPRASGQGLGLGLYIAKGLAEAHGATIDLRSNEQGTTFSLTLPRS